MIQVVNLLQIAHSSRRGVYYSRALLVAVRMKASWTQLGLLPCADVSFVSATSPDVDQEEVKALTE